MAYLSSSHDWCLWMQRNSLVCLAGHSVACEVDQNCSEHGRCVDLVEIQNRSEYKVCICDEGFTGDSCTTDVKRDMVEYTRILTLSLSITLSLSPPHLT
jgi:hypothetical protein